MATQTIQFESVSLREIGSGTITAEIFQGSTTAASLTDITEDATRNGRYTGTVEDKDAGDYDLLVKFDGYTVSEPKYHVDLLLAVGTYVAKATVELDSSVRVKLAAEQPDCNVLRTDVEYKHTQISETVDTVNVTIEEA